MVKLIRRIGLGLVLCSSTVSAEVMLGAYVPGDGFSRQAIEDVNSVVPKRLSFINLFTSFSHDWDYLYWQTTNIVSEGAMPLISWMPVDLNRPDDNILLEIALGLRDDYIDEWGQRLLAWVAQYPEHQQPKLLIRFGHEFNGTWYSYGNSPVYFQAAWQYIHNRFATAGVNQHVGWVWSANNVNVDDYDDVTVYYPGSDYVDWTSIDGYNFGSNYAWTDWEAFEDVYADMYLKLTTNYPEKPIMIAEVGSAEESDTPSVRWGQFGDNSDAYESKNGWIANMLSQLESSFPAVRALAWFNTNKELGWSLTDNGNTGISAYIAGIGSNYYTDYFLDIAELNEAEAESDQPSGQELAALEAADAYALVQAEFQGAESRLAEANSVFEKVQRNHQELSTKRSEARLELDASRINYTNRRNEYLVAHQSYSISRDNFISNRAELNDRRDTYLSDHAAMGVSRDQTLLKRNQFLAIREDFLAIRDEYLELRASYLDAVVNLSATKELGGSDVEALEDVAAIARQAYLDVSEAFREVRDDFFRYRGDFLVANSEFLSNRGRRNSSILHLRSVRESFELSRGKFLESIDGRSSFLSQLIAERKLFLGARDKFLQVNDLLSQSTVDLVAQQQALAIAELEYQQAEVARTEAYTLLSDANHLASLERYSMGTQLLLSDGNNGNGNDKEKTNNGSSKKTDVAEVGSENANEVDDKDMVSSRPISKAEQVALAKSKTPKVKAEKVTERRMKYKNMTREEKAALKQGKLSTLYY